MIAAKVIANNFQRGDDYIILGKEEGWEEDRAYFTRVGTSALGEWKEFSGNYNMDILTAVEDFKFRLQRGY